MAEDGTSHVSAKFREVWQRRHADARQLRPSKVVGYRGEQEELLVLRDPGS